MNQKLKKIQIVFNQEDWETMKAAQDLIGIKTIAKTVKALARSYIAHCTKLTPKLLCDIGAGESTLRLDINKGSGFRILPNAYVGYRFQPGSIVQIDKEKFLIGNK